MARKLGSAAQKTLLLLAGGLTLGLAGSPTTYFKIVKAIAHDWKKINEEELHQAIKNLYRSKLVSAKKNENGSFTLTITRKGQKVALNYKIENIIIPAMKKWDGKWRMVVFDVPEKRRMVRLRLCATMREVGFVRLQDSVWVYPYDCEDFIAMLKAELKIGKDVLYAIADTIEHDRNIREHFHLPSEV